MKRRGFLKALVAAVAAPAAVKAVVEEPVGPVVQHVDPGQWRQVDEPMLRDANYVQVSEKIITCTGDRHSVGTPGIIHEHQRIATAKFKAALDREFLRRERKNRTERLPA